MATKVPGQILCSNCHHFWNTKTTPRFSLKVWVYANGSIQKCPKCGRADGLAINQEGKFIMGGISKSQELPAPAVFQSASIVHGLDVSHHNGIVDWPAKRAAGNVFCSIKATEGTSNVDPMFAINWGASAKAGFINSAYHFYHPSLDAKAQAAHFVRVMGKDLRGHLPPLFDFETLDGLSGKVTAEHARIACLEIENACGVKPIIYGSPGFIEGLGDMSWAQGYLLWVAHYGVKTPRIPKPWHQYTFWQTSDSNGWDLDVFNGTAEMLSGLVVR